MPTCLVWAGEVHQIYLLLMCLRLIKGVTHRILFPQHEPGIPPISQKQYFPTTNSGLWNSFMKKNLKNNRT